MSKRPLTFEIEIRPACSGNDPPPFIVTMPAGTSGHTAHRIVVEGADLSWERFGLAVEIALCTALYSVMAARAQAVRARADIVIGAPAVEPRPSVGTSGTGEAGAEVRIGGGGPP